MKKIIILISVILLCACTINDDKNKILKATIQMDIPNYIDLASNNIVYVQKKLFELQINNDGELKEILDVNFDLKSQLSQNERKYLDYVSDEELISRNPFLITFKKKILNAFIKNSNYFKSKILHKTKQRKLSKLYRH